MQGHIHEDLTSIRAIMERSVKFRSVSGLAGVFAGVFALAGGILAYVLVYGTATEIVLKDTFVGKGDALYILLTIAGAVLVCSAFTGWLLTKWQANKEGLAMDTGVFPVLLRDFTIPLLIGGGVIGLLLVKGFFSLAAPFSLLFYGLSLYNLSKNSLEEIRWLSITELVLGMLGMYFPQYSFLFWLTGFGLLHIGYGLFIYLRHNR
jgi:hypothetical protein